MAVDSSGYVYAAGTSSGQTTYNFRNSITATGTASTNVLLVKYDSSGKAQWAETLTSGTAGASYTGVAADGSGNIYAAGESYGTVTYGFGNGITATGTDIGGTGNVLLVKYNSSGAAQWAETLTTGNGNNGTTFYGVAVDGSGNVYAVGYGYGRTSYGFGNGVTASGAASGGTNVMLVKYQCGASYASLHLAISARIRLPSALQTKTCGMVWIGSAGRILQAGRQPPQGEQHACLHARCRMDLKAHCRLPKSLDDDP